MAISGLRKGALVPFTSLLDRIYPCGTVAGEGVVGEGGQCISKRWFSHCMARWCFIWVFSQCFWTMQGFWGTSKLFLTPRYQYFSPGIIQNRIGPHPLYSFQNCSFYCVSGSSKRLCDYYGLNAAPKIQCCSLYAKCDRI